MSWNCLVSNQLSGHIHYSGTVDVENSVMPLSKETPWTRVHCCMQDFLITVVKLYNTVENCTRVL